MTESNSPGSNLPPGSVEIEFGVPIAGTILPPDQWARTAIKKLPPPGPLDWQAIFGRVAPVVLDLGCGNGRFVVSSAVRRPDHDHIGLDALPVVIRYATRRGNQRGLHNSRFIVGNAFEFLEQFVAHASVTEIHIYHPQPFHDSEAAYRRLITPEFLALTHRALVADGRWVIQTDSHEYWRYIAMIAPSFFEFHEQSGPWPDAPAGRTRREIMARSKNLPVFRGWGVPRRDLTSDAIAKLIETLPLPQFQSQRRRETEKRRKRRRR